jgi:histidine decarboxylase
MKREQLEKILQGAVGPYENYCDGYLSFYPNKRGNYICAITLSTAKVPKKFYHTGSEKLDEINAYDLAEAEGAYIGQLNFIPATSFCGPMGAIWGYDLVKPQDLREEEILEAKDHKGEQIPVYSAGPLIKAAKLLFGTKKEVHFPILPGAQVPHAGKSIEKPGPTRLYCGIGIGIPEDRKRAAVLWMEDIGILDCAEERIIESLAKSVIEVGYNQDVKYQEIFVGVKDTGEINGEEIGCAFVAVPYIVLAEGVVPEKDINKLMKLSLEEWDNEAKSYFLCNIESKR